MDKLDMQTPDLTTENIEKIAKLFPQVITEKRDENGKIVKAIDFDLLRQELSKDVVEDSDERYRLDRPGKKASILKANTPINKTLRPDRESSVNFDTTENLYLEGDNFEILKILQESYLGKIKMIYIDPPYNTGKDFVYKDNFTKNKSDYEGALGIEDEDGGKLFRNTDTNGRFHSDWLSMMYERLVVARDLLKDDGVIFMSIDDNEVHNLRKIADEVFGEKNFVNSLIRNSNPGGDKGDYIETTKQYVLVYSKYIDLITDFGFVLNVDSEKYKLEDEHGFYKKGGQLEKRGNDSTIYTHPNLGYSIYYDPNQKDIVILYDYNREELLKDRTTKMIYKNPDESLLNKGYFCVRPRITNDGNPGRWRLQESTFLERYKNNDFIFEEQLGLYKIYEKDRISDTKFIKLKDILGSDCGKQTNDTIDLIGGKYFDYPKPVDFMVYCLNSLQTNHGIFLDFFSGSATTAHAVMQLNAEDGGNRKWIMAQLPEETEESSEAYKAGYKYITEIGKERIRRAGKKILEENAEKLKDRDDELDIGFRVYKADTTNMKDTYYHPSEVKQSELELFSSNIKEDRTPEDLLTQVMLDRGLTLDLPIVEKTISGHKVFFVADNALVACFDENLNIDIVDEIAKSEPIKVIFRDSSFKDDKDRINVETKLKRLSPETEVKVI